LLVLLKKLRFGARNLAFYLQIRSGKSFFARITITKVIYSTREKGKKMKKNEKNIQGK